MRSQSSKFAILTILTILAGPSLEAQAPTGENNRICGRLLSDILMEKVKEKKDVGKALAANLLAQGPLTSPPSEQLGAPADGDSSTGLVSGASFPKLLGLAAESGLLTSTKDTLTLNLSPFDVAAISNREVLERQSEYEKTLNRRLRRIGLSITSGGKGESFDRDGDGTADPALEAKELGDIVKWEAKWRFLGSRDRRDRKNVEAFFSDMSIDELFTALDAKLREIEARPDVRGAIDAKGCIDVERLKASISHPDVVERLTEAADVAAKLKETVDAVNKKIDGRWIWSVVGGGTERRDEFGPDQWTFGLRGAAGSIENHGFTFNLDYSQTDGLGEASDPKLLKLAAEYAILAFKNGFLGEDGVKVALSGAYEMFDDVPAATHDTNAKVNAKLELPVSKQIKIPISVTWANHKDLLEKEEEIRGHIGFTIDLSKLKELKP